MKIIKWWVDRFAIGGLMLGSLFSTLTGILLLLYAVFFIDPYIKTGKNNTFGISEFQNGIPVQVKMPSYKSWTAEIPYPDSSGTGRIFLNTAAGPLRNGATVTTGQFDTGTLYVTTTDRMQRFLLLLPAILKVLTFSFVAWQIAVLLSTVRAGESFSTENNKRLLRSGWLILGIYLFLTVYEIFYQPFGAYTMHTFSGEMVTDIYPDQQVSFSWLVVGCIFIILSLAFRKGETLQQEQDLTV